MFRSIALGLLTLQAPVALATDKMDCGYPLNEAERSYCAEQALEEAENDVNAAYMKALARMSELDESKAQADKGSRAALEAAQAAWRDFRDKDCTAYAFPMRSSGEGKSLFQGCMIVMTRQRTEDLNAMVADYGN